MLVGENAVLPYLFYQILDVFIFDIKNFAFVVNCQEYNTQTIFTDLNIKSQNLAPPLFPFPLDAMAIRIFRMPLPKSSPTKGFIKISFFHSSKSSRSEWCFFAKRLNCRLNSWLT